MREEKARAGLQATLGESARRPFPNLGEVRGARDALAQRRSQRHRRTAVASLLMLALGGVILRGFVDGKSLRNMVNKVIGAAAPLVAATPRAEPTVNPRARTQPEAAAPPEAHVRPTPSAPPSGTTTPVRDPSVTVAAPSSVGTTVSPTTDQPLVREALSASSDPGQVASDLTEPFIPLLPSDIGGSPDDLAGLAQDPASPLDGAGEDLPPSNMDGVGSFDAFGLPGAGDAIGILPGMEGVTGTLPGGDVGDLTGSLP